jgi:hypothetical protein
VPLAFAIPFLRSSLGDWLSFGVAIGYLAALRLLGELIERKVRSAQDSRTHGT